MTEPPGGDAPSYASCLGFVREGGVALERYRVLGGRTPVAPGGTDFHSSEKVSCPDCLVTRHKDGRTVFSHRAACERPGPLEPRDFQTVSETRRDEDGHRRTWTVRFAKGAPLPGEDGALRANRIELTVTDARGRQTCRNCWATDLGVDAGNALELGRVRPRPPAHRERQQQHAQDQGLPPGARLRGLRHEGPSARAARPGGSARTDLERPDPALRQTQVPVAWKTARTPPLAAQGPPHPARRPRLPASA